MILEQLYKAGIRQITTVSELKNSSNYCGIGHRSLFPLLPLYCPLSGSFFVVLPKIHTMSQPVMWFIADLDRIRIVN